MLTLDAEMRRADSHTATARLREAEALLFGLITELRSENDPLLPHYVRARDAVLLALDLTHVATDALVARES